MITSILILLATGVVQAKVSTGVLGLDSMITEKYITKFSFSSGSHGTIGGDFLVPKAYLDKRPRWLLRHPNAEFSSLQVALYNEDDWEAYNTMIVKGSLCVERLRRATFRTNVPLHQMAVEEEHLPVNLDHTITSEENSHYWYAIVADCSLEEYDAHPPNIKYTLVFKNGGQHLPADEDYMMPAQLFVFACGLPFFGGYFYLLRKQYRDFGQVHLAVVLLGIASGLQFSSIGCELLHLFRYTQDGKGLRWRHSYFPADFLSEMLQGLSELLIAFVFIALSFGWTVVPQLGTTSFADAIRRPHLWFSQVSKASVFLFLLAITQIALEVLGRGFEDDFNQFHDHEHWPGYTLMLIRLGLATVFLVGIYISKSSERARTTAAVDSFFTWLRVSGFIWFAAFPTVVFFAGFFAPYRRHAIVTVGAITVQSDAIGILVYNFLTRRSYFKISSMSNMGTVYAGGVKHGKICVD